MEPAKIDWKRIESVFVEDKLYENINAPKWVDFLAPDGNSLDDGSDESWFCKPDCKHPKTAEDFLRTPPSLKIPRFIERLPFGDRSQRDARLKRRGQTNLPSNERTKFNEDGENQNPNSPSPNSINLHSKSMKAVIKSSSEKNRLINDTPQNDNDSDQLLPKLRSTLSAKNLFAGQNILGHITEFCNELKKLASSRARERDNVEEKGANEVLVSQNSHAVADESQRKDKEVLIDKEKCEAAVMSSGKQRKIKRFDDEAENTPIPLKLEILKHKAEGRVLQIRTNPPSPQCFSATRKTPKTATTPLRKVSPVISKPMQERKIFQEIEQKNEVVRKEEPEAKAKTVSNLVDGRGGEPARTLDVFWFLKPCTTLSS